MCIRVQPENSSTYVYYTYEITPMPGKTFVFLYTS